jgi:hypothetical protein
LKIYISKRKRNEKGLESLFDLGETLKHQIVELVSKDVSECQLVIIKEAISECQLVIIKEATTEFPTLEKDSIIQVLKGQATPIIFHPTKFAPKYIIIRLCKLKIKGNFSRQQEKRIK